MSEVGEHQAGAAGLAGDAAEGAVAHVVAADCRKAAAAVAAMLGAAARPSEAIDRAIEIGLLEPAYVQSLLEDHFAGRADNSHHIWCLLTLVLWHEKFMSARAE